MSSIYLNNHSYSYDEIKKGNFLSHPALDFCYEWLNGKENFIIHTSGSTGIPKPITLHRNDIVQSIQMTVEALKLQTGNQSLVCLHSEFIAGKMMLARSLAMHMDITIIHPVSNPLKQFTNNTLFDFIALVPLQLETILKETPEKVKILNRMKAIIIGGATIHISLEKQIQNLEAPVYHTFGMTETISHIALKRLNGKEKSDYFSTLGNIVVEKDDRDCLVIHSPFTKSPLVTNDIVELKDNKHFKWLGRLDHIINSGGIKISPENVEQNISQLFHQLNISVRFFVTGIPHTTLGEAVTLVIESAPWEEAFMIQLKNRLKNILSRFEIPKLIFFKDKFTETSTGKIDRRTIKTELINFSSEN